jgi:hypothetical protein
MPKVYSHVVLGNRLNLEHNQAAASLKTLTTRAKLQSYCLAKRNSNCSGVFF